MPDYQIIAERHGWKSDLDRGHQIVKSLTALSPKQRADFDITAYRGERVAFVGGGAPQAARATF